MIFVICGIVVIAWTLVWLNRPITPCEVCGHELVSIDYDEWYCDHCCCDRRPEKD